jgi:hypothetical protein
MSIGESVFGEGGFDARHHAGTPHGRRDSWDSSGPSFLRKAKPLIGVVQGNLDEASKLACGVDSGYRPCASASIATPELGRAKNRP